MLGHLVFPSVSTLNRHYCVCPDRSLTHIEAGKSDEVWAPILNDAPRQTLSWSKSWNNTEVLVN